jgi:hypothetical protein
MMVMMIVIIKANLPTLSYVQAQLPWVWLSLLVLVAVSQGHYYLVLLVARLVVLVVYLMTMMNLGWRPSRRVLEQ